MLPNALRHELQLRTKRIVPVFRSCGCPAKYKMPFPPLPQFGLQISKRLLACQKNLVHCSLEKFVGQHRLLRVYLRAGFVRQYSELFQHRIHAAADSVVNPLAVAVTNHGARSARHKTLIDCAGLRFRPA